FEPCGRGDQLLGMRGAQQEREIRGDGELDVVRHGELATRRGRLLRTPLPLWERVVPSEARDRVRGPSPATPLTRLVARCTRHDPPSPTRGEGKRVCLASSVHHANIPCRNHARQG